MKENTKLNSTFAVALIALISSLGIPVTDTMFDTELKDYYVCDVNEALIIQFLGGVSGTGYSGYPYADSRKGAKYCKSADGVKGEWISLSKYAKDKGLDPYDFMEKDEQEGGAIKYICPPLNECYEVEN